MILDRLMVPLENFELLHKTNCYRGLIILIGIWDIVHQGFPQSIRNSLNTKEGLQN